MEGIETSESSCTLVEDLTPLELNPSLIRPFSHFLTEEFGVEKLNQGSKFEEELGLALEENFKIGIKDIYPEPRSPPDTLNLMSFSMEEDIVTASTTPTKENEHANIDVVDGNIGSNNMLRENNNEEGVVNSEASSRRLEKLDKVRSRFYTLYEATIRTRRNVSETPGNTSSGLGFLIGNFATKVGIRSSTNRTTHV